ncbi:hypothetical protein HZ992_12510 [Rhizobacter sp. AJA081-3]|uniref:hypothetical protein n=1 Tax=Rhizobacter sp. AJA081-3 TaxID=2753607 RepID=UPI001AE0CF36|nr:hypothetical protein [Rhizobacter sp. AJA081-3]QTN25718.1 hypothetical protein HZ992_12510 [Rhizobacter sp. AJA081-3]
MPAPATTTATYYLSGADLVQDGHGRITLSLLADGRLRVSARINSTDESRSYRLTLRADGAAAEWLSLDIGGALGVGEATLANPPQRFEDLLRTPQTAVVLEQSGREKMRGAVGGVAVALIDDLTIDGFLAYIQRHDVRDVKRLMSALPPAMRSNHTLVGRSGGLQATSVEAPRIVSFGADGRLLAAFQSDVGPRRETVELAELRADGTWKFAEIEVPTRRVASEVCTSCHGRQPRPVWSAYNQWPGVFGADGDKLTDAEVVTLTRLRATQRDSDRFHVLPIRPVRNGDTFHIAHRDYTFANFNATGEIVRAVTEGAWLRIRQAPRAADLRLGFFLNRCDDALRQETNPRWARFKSAMVAAGQPQQTDTVAILRAMGIANPVEELQIGKTAPNLTAADGLGYNQAASGLTTFIEFLLLDDWIADEPELGRRLAALADVGRGYVNGVYTGYGLGMANLEEARRFRMLHNYGLHGEDLQRSREKHTAPNYFDGLWRMEQGLLTPARDAICSHLQGR